MPFLDLVHLRAQRCQECGAVLAVPGARSFLVDDAGDPVNFSQEDPPAEMLVRLLCRNGHATELAVPNELSAEETLSAPDEAPIGADAHIVSGITESGKSIPVAQ